METSQASSTSASSDVERPRRRDGIGRGSQGEEIEQAVDADEVRRGAGGDGEQLGLGDGLGEGRLELGRGDLLLGEELLEELVVGLGDGLDELAARLVGGRREVGRDVALGGLLALVDVSLHAEQIDDALEVVLAADGDLDGHDLRAEGLAQALDGEREVGALAVEHVAEEDAREAAFVGARPEPLGLDLDAEDAVDDHEGRLDDPQRGDGVGEEARVAGRVEEIEAESLALDVRKAGRQAELPALLVVVVVGDGRAVDHVPQAIDHAGLVQQALEQRSLAGTAMADEGDVPDLAWVVHPGSPRVSSRRLPARVRARAQFAARSEG